MGIDDVRIILDKIPENGFMPGTQISGKIILRVHKKKHIKDLNITLQGKAEVNFYTHEIRWFNKHYHSSKGSVDLSAEKPAVLLNSIKLYRRLSDNSYFRDEQTFANIFYSLLADGYLEPGDNEFHFSIPLPDNLPSSFNSKYGNIRYKLKVRKKTDTLYKVEFRMANCKVNTFPKKIDPGFIEPITYKETKEFQLFLSSSDPVSFTLKLPKSYYVVGETFTVIVEINNTSKIDITDINVTLGQIVLCIGKYMGYKNVKCKDQILAEAPCGGVKPGDVKTWPVTFTIPNMPNVDTYTEPCSIIKLFNVITVTASPDLMCSSLRSLNVIAPIEISTLPLQVPAIPAMTLPLNIAGTSTSIHSQPTNIGFIFQPSVDPSFAPPFPQPAVPPSAPAYSLDSDPPPPYPGTPPDLAETINRLRLS